MIKNITRYSAGAFFAVASLAVALPAHATVLSGDSSSSTFSDLTCTSCALTSLTSTQLTLGTTSNGGGNSILSIVTPFSFSANSAASGIQLAELTLIVGNKPGTGQTGVSFDYNLVLAFAIPSLPNQTQTFTDTISGNSGTGANGDVTVSNLSLSSSSIVLSPNWTLTNLDFVPGGTGSGFSDTTWTGKGGSDFCQSTACDLWLEGDLVFTGTVGVPEPGTLALLGGGLIGMVVLRRRVAKRKLA